MKKYLPFIIVLALPLVFVIGVVVYVLFFSPSPLSSEHSFVMTDKDNFVYVNSEGVLEIDENKINSDHYDHISKKEIDFWLYDAEKKEAEEVSLEEVQEFKLEEGEKSPNGLTVEYRYSHSDIPAIFGAESQRGYYISDGERSSKLEIDRYRGLEVVGWVIN